jgi:hypothetical protein
MDNVQKTNNGINMSSSQTFRSYLVKNQAERNQQGKGTFEEATVASF